MDGEHRHVMKCPRLSTRPANSACGTIWGHFPTHASFRFREHIGHLRELGISNDQEIDVTGRARRAGGHRAEDAGIEQSIGQRCECRTEDVRHAHGHVEERPK